MKYLITIILLFFISQYISSQDNTDAVYYKKGDIVKFDCYGISSENLDKLLQDREESKVKDKIIEEKDKQISLKDLLISEQSKENNLLKNDAALYKASLSIQYELNKIYKEDYNSFNTLRIQNKILGITTGVSVSIALAELAGIIVFGVLNYYGK